jgi:hypothetical protein
VRNTWNRFMIQTSRAEGTDYRFFDYKKSLATIGRKHSGDNESQSYKMLKLINIHVKNSFNGPDYLFFVNTLMLPCYHYIIFFIAKTMRLQKLTCLCEWQCYLQFCSN